MDRIARWADILVNYSLNLQDGDLVEITFEDGGKALAREVYRKALQAGAHPVFSLDDSEFSRIFYEEASDEQLEHIPDHVEHKVEDLDASLRIRAPSNTRELAEVDPARMQQAQTARKELKDEIIEHTTWSLTQFPTKALAQEAEMSYQAYREFAMDACVKDWEEESRKYQQLKQKVDQGSEVRIQGKDTDLTFSIGERDGIKRVGALSDGTSNVPGGEVFTAPIVDSVEGEIYFELPAVTGGREVKGVRLVFEDGEVVDFTAEKNEDLLEERLQTDDGSDRLGEFGIGTNFDIDRFTKNILFDEKIGGTVHLALGSAYRKCFERVVDLDAIDQRDLDDEAFHDLIAEAREALRDEEFDALLDQAGRDEQRILTTFRDRWEELADPEDSQVNDSSVHWDMIKDLREQGSMSIDGETILEEGEFVGVDAL
ncbi:MAG: aminopeptidase [Candidatus Nanohaloarchaea archaeon]|nr:aminopeptidase [Candidatus Nanohaloarchaea archaeon]